MVYCIIMRLCKAWLSIGGDSMDYKNRIKEFRTKRNMTQSQLSSLAGISRVFLSEIENGKRNPSFATVEKLARALDAEISDIFYAIRSATENIPCC